MKIIKIACVMFIMSSITWGCNQGNSDKQDTKQKQAQEPIQPIQFQTNTESDKYGRKSGDQHYGHDHAPANQQPVNQLNTPQATPAGGPDKFGRNPGDQHYGHDHE